MRSWPPALSRCAATCREATAKVGLPRKPGAEAHGHGHLWGACAAARGQGAFGARVLEAAEVLRGDGAVAPLQVVAEAVDLESRGRGGLTVTYTWFCNGFGGILEYFVGFRHGFQGDLDGFVSLCMGLTDGSTWNR